MPTYTSLCSEFYFSRDFRRDIQSMAVRRKEETKKDVWKDRGMNGFSMPLYLLFHYLIFVGEVRDVKEKNIFYNEKISGLWSTLVCKDILKEDLQVHET